MIPAPRPALMLSAALLVALPPPTVQEPDGTLAGLDTDAVDALFARWNRTDSPGCALAIYRGGDVLYAKGYGMADLEHDVPIRPDSVFRIASVSKQFTAACIVLLAQDGVLSLDDDVRRWLPELTDQGETITLRHMLHHTSGLREYTELMTMAGIEDTIEFTNERALELIARQEGLDFAPGERYSYSNSGYFLLSQVVERATGKSLRAVAQERIFGPLGMRRTHFHDDHRELVPGRVAGYSKGEGGGFRLDMTDLQMVGDGGLYTTVLDCLAWDQNFHEPSIGGEEFLTTLLTPGRLTDGSEIDYALGLGIGSYRGLPTVSHGGSWVGYRTHMLRFPEQHTTIVCFANLASINPGRLCRRVADLVLAGELAEPEAAAPRAASSRAERRAPPRIELEPAQLRRYVGRFHSRELGVDYELVLADDGGLLMRGPWDEPVPLECERPAVFVSARGARLRFEPGSAEAGGFRLDGWGIKDLRFRRVDG